MDVLSTRMLEPVLLQDAQAKGIRIDCIPFIEIRHRSTSDIVQQLGDLNSRDIFVFTSQHAVHAVMELIKNLHNKTYCIEGVTADTVRKTTLNIRATAPYAKELIKLIEIDREAHYYFFCGDKRLPTIPRFLQQNKLRFSEIICYENIAVPQKLHKQYEAIMFYSPSGVESYFSLNTPQPDQKYYCIGNTTAQALSKYCKGNIIIAEKPEIRAMLEKING